MADTLSTQKCHCIELLRAIALKGRDTILLSIRVVSQSKIRFILVVVVWFASDLPIVKHGQLVKNQQPELRH